ATMVLLPGLLRDFSLRPALEVSNIQRFQGLGYLAKLSDRSLSNDVKPSFTRLYVYQTRSGAWLHHLDPWCEQSYFCSWLSALFDVNSPFATYTARKEVGPG